MITMSNSPNYRREGPGQFLIAERVVSPREIIDKLWQQLTPRRREKLLAVVAKRSRHMVGIMENIYDQGNVHAVIRSSESFGHYQLARVASVRQKKSSRTTSGADKWVHVTDFTNIRDAIQHYRSQGHQIGATAFTPQAIPINEVDFSRPTALIFGNEKDGCSKEAKELSDFHCLIPTVGLTPSFNISVAAAITFYHVHCSQKKSGHDYLLSSAQREELLAEYLLNSFAHRPQYLAELFKAQSSC